MKTEKCKGELLLLNSEKLRPHAFEGCRELQRIVVQEGVTVLPDYLFAECRSLVEAELPSSLRELGSHVFYNCRSLVSLSVPAQLVSVGDGAFKNCPLLRNITVRGMRAGEDQCVRKILFDIEQETELTLEYDDGTARLVMPQYDYQYVANEPARIFSEVSYGTGHYYRKCVNARELQFDTYDRLFPMSCRENSARTVSEQCMARLHFPYRLSGQAADQYRSYLTGHFEETAGRLLAESELERAALEKLLWLGDFGVLTRETLPRALELAQAAGNAEAVAWLMEYRSRHFTAERKRFEL